MTRQLAVALHGHRIRSPADLVAADVDNVVQAIYISMGFEVRQRDREICHDLPTFGNIGQCFLPFSVFYLDLPVVDNIRSCGQYPFVPLLGILPRFTYFYLVLSSLFAFTQIILPTITP